MPDPIPSTPVSTDDQPNTLGHPMFFRISDGVDGADVVQVGTSSVKGVTITTGSGPGAVVATEAAGSSIYILGTDGTTSRIIKTDASGDPMVVGNIASGAADSGNPVKVGAVFNAAAPTLLTGQRGDLQVDVNGNLKVVLTSAAVTQGAAAATHASPWWVRRTDGTHDEFVPIAGAPVTAATDGGIVMMGSDYGAVTPVYRVPKVDSTGELFIEGDIADAATDASTNNPVKMGAMFNTTAPTYTTGQRTTLQTDASGNLKVTIPSGAVTANQGTKNASHAQAWWVQMSDGTDDMAVPVAGQTFVPASDGGLYIFGSDYGGTPAARVMKVDSSGFIYPIGNVADGATDAGNPIKVGGRFDTATGRTTPLVAGQRGDLMLDAQGRLLVDIGAGGGGSPTTPIYDSPGWPAGTKQDYNTVAAVASGATNNHDYTLVATDFMLTEVKATGAAPLKAELMVGPLATLLSKEVGFNSQSNPDIRFTFNPPLKVTFVATATVRVARTNRYSGAQDVYSTIKGFQV